MATSVCSTLCSYLSHRKGGGGAPPSPDRQVRAMDLSNRRRVLRSLVAIVVAVIVFFAMAEAAGAQSQTSGTNRRPTSTTNRRPTSTTNRRPTTTAPYPGSAPTVPAPGGRPSIALNVTSAVPGQRVRVTGCDFDPAAFIRITLNPGNSAGGGTACPGAPAQQGLGSQPFQNVLSSAGHAPASVSRFELVAQDAVCPFNHTTNAALPDTTSGGGIASTTADNDGCVDAFVTVPANLAAGSYQLCAIPVGQEAACANIKLTVAGSDRGRSFARTGFVLLPLLLGALAAIIIGRTLVRRDRRSRRNAAAR
jgi:hypothetical protein